ncbi:MAG: symmetrical bis(5'-nucleosyl)-tetraphosphatase, partial [Pseudomonadales bacterium]|nr:symmetrical bis(5'-nucleosyl)-tetraphosphatase [Pseudomonadales bacterium]
GPDNLKTLEFVMGLDDAVVVLGNHDLHFLAVALNCKKPGKHDTLEDLLASDRLEEIVHWMRFLPLVHHDKEAGYTLVHAGLPPQWDLQTCLERAAEITRALQSQRYRDFLRGMYGDEPAQWDDELEGVERLRIICNYLTRMRYCTAEGKMELSHRANLKPDGYEPWFEWPRPDHQGPKIIFGHWAAIQGRTGRPDVIGLDTGCIWGGHLTAMRLEDGEFCQVPGPSRSAPFEE